MPNERRDWTIAFALTIAGTLGCVRWLLHPATRTDQLVATVLVVLCTIVVVGMWQDRPR
jgi:hypothetical protein